MHFKTDPLDCKSIPKLDQPVSLNWGHMGEEGRREGEGEELIKGNTALGQHGGSTSKGVCYTSLMS